jgi:thymidylate synthase ThyX
LIHDGPKVTLIDATKDPFNLSIASARTCYSGKGVIFPESVAGTVKERALRDRIARETKKAGHLTTRQHVQFIFGIWDISRQSIWSYLHSHPYYNSGQVSQRYVEVKPDAVVLPPLSEAGKKIYQDLVSAQMLAYQELIRILLPAVDVLYFELFPHRVRKKEKWAGVIKKKAMEIARYVLPLGTSAYLYYTINGLTLHRLWRMANFWEPVWERKILMERMVREVEKWDPLFFQEMADPLPLERTPEYGIITGLNSGNFQKIEKRDTKQAKKAFDASLNGKFSELVSYSTNAPEIIKNSLKSVFGFSDEISFSDNLSSLLLDPQKFSYWGDTMNPSILSPMARTLEMVHFTFKKKISHTADSQDQRHRAVPGARPVLAAVYDGEIDYITPKLILQSDNALEIYSRIMAKTFAGVNQLCELGEKIDEAILALPNAYPVRYYETGSLLNLYHKWKLRLCYLAQEEIFQASVDEVQSVRKVFPDLVQWISAPCGIRRESGLAPFCPEGERFCGVGVWKMGVADYDRVI